MSSANGLATLQGKRPLFSFGVISDIQYADIPDRRSFLGLPRYYQHSILVLQRAVQNWNRLNKLKFVVNFGDIVDGFCPKDQSVNAIKNVLAKFEAFDGAVYHMIGNHCLYNLPRDKLLPLLKIPHFESRAYYDFSPVPEFRFVVLDGYDISAIGWPQGHSNTIEALNFLQEKNPNSDKNSPDGLVGLERRFLMFNGAVGKDQLKWLDEVLQDASKSKQKVVLSCHVPLHPGATCEEALLWNYDEVMDLVHQYNCVKVCLAGHTHRDGYAIDSFGVHHRVFEAALECPPVLKAGEDEITVTWLYNQTVREGTDSTYKTVKVKLCYAPISQEDRAWRKTVDDLKKDKTCQFKVVTKPYAPSNNSFTWTIEKDIPTATYFVRAYALNANDIEVAYGQTTDTHKETNLFEVQGITGRHATLDIVSGCFSAFSIVALFGFFYMDKRNAKQK